MNWCPPIPSGRGKPEDRASGCLSHDPPWLIGKTFRPNAALPDHHRAELYPSLHLEKMGRGGGSRTRSPEPYALKKRHLPFQCPRVPALDTLAYPIQLLCSGRWPPISGPHGSIREPTKACSRSPPSAPMRTCLQDFSLVCGIYIRTKICRAAEATRAGKPRLAGLRGDSL
jgi:hypothetical protein